MLRKLLKYDLRSVGRFWWIVMIFLLGFFFVGAVSMRVYLESNDALIMAMDAGTLYVIMMLMSYLTFLVSMAGISICVLAVEVLIFIRFFKHFFTDEGYLTFTLPVSRKQLFFSKVVTSVVWMSLTGVVMGVGFVLMLLIVPTNTFRQDVFPEIVNGLKFSFEETHWTQWLWVALWQIIGGLISVASLILSPCVVYFCITLGSTVVKRAKVFAAIGAYLLMNGITYVASQILTTFGMLSLSLGIFDILYQASDLELNILITLVFLLAFAVVSTLAAFFYCLTQNILERRLNLA